MISRYSYLLYIAVFSFVCLVVCSSTTSLWFLRGILGGPQGVLEIGYQQTLLSTKVLHGDVAGMMNVYAGFSPTIFSRVVYLQDRSWEYIVGIPSLKNQFHAQKSLNDVGWSSSRLGWILIGKRALQGSINENNNMATQREVSIVSGFKAEMSSIFQQNLPINPIFFIRTLPGFASLDSGVAIYATTEKQALHGVTSYTGTRFIGKHSDKVVQGKDQDSNALNVSIQRELITLLPSEFLSAINASIAREFHFTKTNPAVFNKESNGSPTEVFLDGQGVAIGVSAGADEFITTFLKYVRSEQGARHPQRKGFLLPDGTVGHEYVPSVPIISFEKTENPACEKLSGYDEQIFMCKNSNGSATIGTSIHAAQKLVEKIKEDNSQVEGSVSGDFLKKILPGNIFQRLLFTGDAKGLDFWAIY